MTIANVHVRYAYLLGVSLANFGYIGTLPRDKNSKIVAPVNINVTVSLALYNTWKYTVGAQEWSFKLPLGTTSVV